MARAYPPAPLVSASLLRGLLAYWKFDNASGTSVTDATGNGHTGTWAGTLGSQWGTGIINGDGVFNGTNNFIGLGSTLQASMTAAFTVAGWINPTSATGVYDLIGTGAPGSSPFKGFRCLTNAKEIEFQVGNGATSASSFSAASLSAAWHHWACTYDGKTAFSYVDAVRSTGATLTGPMVASTNAMQIGDTTGSLHPAAGGMDEMGAWSRALGPGEILALRNLGNGIQYPFTGAAA
jgi:hypothetical protein